MTETTPDSASAEPLETDTPDIESLVADWFDWTECADALGLSMTKVRQFIREHELAAVVPAPGRAQSIPAGFILEGEIVKGLPGILTVLHDGGYDDAQIITWLYTPDETLPGRPIDALRENRGSEAKRRAQAMAF